MSAPPPAIADAFVETVAPTPAALLGRECWLGELGAQTPEAECTQCERQVELEIVGKFADWLGVGVAWSEARERDERIRVSEERAEHRGPGFHFQRRPLERHSSLERRTAKALRNLARFAPGTAFVLGTTFRSRLRARSRQAQTARDFPTRFSGSPLVSSSERAVQVERGADQRQVGERLREVAERLAAGPVCSAYSPRWFA